MAQCLVVLDHQELGATFKVSSPILTASQPMKIKMIYNNTIKHDRLLSDDHPLLSHLGHLREKIGLDTLYPGTPIDTPMCNVCLRSWEVEN
jgi:hypothetical protein